MAHQFLQKKTVSGVEIITFVPNTNMKLFATTAFCDKSVIGKNPEVICEAAGIPIDSYEKFKKLDPHFSEWLEQKRYDFGGKNKRGALEAIGMAKALEGDFQFWKLLAQREGVISHDKLEIGLSIPANLAALGELDDDAIEIMHNSIMDSLRGADSGEANLLEVDRGGEREVDSSGAAEVPERQVALAPELGSDGEQSLLGEYSF